MSKKYKFIAVFSFGFLILLCGCNSQLQEVELPSATIDPTATRTSSPTMTATSTMTATITPSPTSTPTATPDLPVAFSTPFPEPLQEINLENIDQIREIARYGSPVIRGSWRSTDGSKLFLATTTGMIVFDLLTNQIINQLDLVPPPQETIFDFRFSTSTDGNRFTISFHDKVEVWDIVDGKIFEFLFNNKDKYLAFKTAEISSDGKLVGVRHPDEQEILLYDLENGQIISEQPSLKGWGFFFSPSGTWFLTSDIFGDGVLYRRSDWSRFRDVVVNSNQTLRGFSPDDNLLVIQDDASLMIFQIEPWTLIRQINAPVENSQERSSIVFSPDSSKIGISSNNGAEAWDIYSGERVSKNPDIKSILMLSNNGIITPFSDRYQDIYHKLEIDQEEQLYTEDFDIKILNNPEGIITSRQYYDPKAGTHIYKICQDFNKSEPYCQVFSDPIIINFDGKIYSLVNKDDNNSYEVHQITDESQTSIGKIHLKADHKKIIWLSSSQELLLLNKYSSATRIDNIDLWDITSDTIIKQWSGYISQFAVSKDEKLISFAMNKICGVRFCGSELVVYDPWNNQVVFSDTFTNNNFFTAMEFNSNNNLMYSSAEYISISGDYLVQFYVLDMTTKEKSELGLLINMDNSHEFTAIDFSQNGELFAVGCTDGRIRIYDTSTYSEIYSWQAHNGSINDLEFTEEGDLIISSSISGMSGDGFARAWGIWN